MSGAPKNPHGWYDDGDYTGSTGGGTGGDTGDGGGTTGDGGGTNPGGGTYDDDDNGGGFTGDLATVAYTGKYADLLNKPILSNVAFTGSYNDLLEAPTFSTVATSGSYTDLINIPSSASVWTATTDYGGIIVNVNTINNAITRLKGGGGLELTQGFSTESSVSSYSLALNPNLVWTGYLQPNGEGVVPEFYLETHVIIDRDGYIPAGSVKDFPDWYQELKTLGVSGTALGAVALAVATWGVGGAAIKSAVSGIFDKIKKAFGGDPDGGGGGGGEGGGGNPEEEAPAIQWNTIGGRPFAITTAFPTLGSVLGGNAGFTGDITVANKTPLGATNALYVMNYDNFSVNPITGNVIFDTGSFTIADKTLLIDFNDRIFRAKNVKVEATISFYDENAPLTNPSGFVPVLDLYKTTHGLWRFTKDGVFHKDSAVVTYSTAQDRYIFHGIITNGAPTPASDYETGAPKPSLWTKAKRVFTRNNQNEISPADPMGDQLRQAGSQQDQQIHSLKVQADQLRTEKNALISQAAKVKRVADQAKAKKGIKGLWTKITKKAKEIQKDLPSGPLEAVAKMRGAVTKAVQNAKTAVNVNGAKAGDAITKALLI